MNQSKRANNDEGEFDFGKVKRKFRRIGIPGFVGDLADGTSIVGGIVEDISAGGFKITNIPKTFTAEKHVYTTIVSGGGRHYKILARPCWRKQSSELSNVEMGFKILDAPWEWLELTMDELVKFEKGSGFGFSA